MKSTLLCLGFGYTAQRFAARFAQMGGVVIGTTRKHNKMAEMAGSGVTPILWPGTSLTEALKQADHVLVSAAPGPEGDPFLAAIGAEIASAAGRLKWVGYLSTIGVYGDQQGGWVDETTPCMPETKRGRDRLAAETAWLAVPKLPVHIFRLGGIYGPGRGPFTKLRAGTARRIVKPGQVFNRMHVDDIATALLASTTRPTPGTIYNLCDDDPRPPQEIIATAAELLDLPVPPEEPFETAEMSPMARGFYAASKRVRNDRIKDALEVRLQYPDHRSGLEAILRAETDCRSG